MEEFAISGSQRSTIQSLQEVRRNQGINQNELATGRLNPRTNVIADLASQALSDRAGDIASARNDIDQGLSSLQAADEGLDAIEESLDLARAIADEFESTTDAARQAELQAQFDEVARQIDFLAEDSSFGGVNLISSNPSSETVDFGTEPGSELTLNGEASDSASLGLTLSVASVDAAISEVRSSRESIGSQATALEIRNDFNENLANQLEAGAAELVEVDLNEAAAENLALETRNQLGNAAQSIAVQSERAILQLF
ncbi:MAG: flagellin [Rhodospirillaceae bacterium]